MSLTADMARIALSETSIMTIAQLYGDHGRTHSSGFGLCRGPCHAECRECRGTGEIGAINSDCGVVGQEWV